MLYLRTGSGNRWGSSSSPDRIASIFVDFYDENERTSGKDGYEIMEEMRNEVCISGNSVLSAELSSLVM